MYALYCCEAVFCLYKEHISHIGSLELSVFYTENKILESINVYNCN